MQETNRFRKEHDRSDVKSNKQLAATAQEFAEYMARTDRYGHHADGRTPAERASAHDYEYCLVSENIGMRYDSTGYETGPLARGLVQGWIDSPVHRENMLDPDVTEIGIGLAMSDNSGRYYAVQMFGRPPSASIEFSVTNRSRTEVEYQIGDRTFSLPPRVTRTHTRCRPAEMTVQFPEQEEETVAVESGVRYVVRRGDDGQLQLAASAEKAS